MVAHVGEINEEGKEVGGGIDSGVIVPEIALRWILLNVVTSNVELAVLSNTCKSWRHVCMRFLLEQAKEAAEVTQEETGIATSELESQPPIVNGMATKVTVARGGLPVDRPLLLLASMVKELLVRSDCNDDRFPKGETFCATWFPSDGIMQSSLEGPDAKGNHDNAASANNSSEDFVPLLEQLAEEKTSTARCADKNICSVPGAAAAARRILEMIQQTHTNGNNVPFLLSDDDTNNTRCRHYHRRTGTSTDDTTTSSEPHYATATEWRGYRSAWEVLQPFGYARAFVESVLAEAAALAIALCPEEDEYFLPTVAVRGACVARPEDYCFCRDWDPSLFSDTALNQFEKAYATVSAGATAVTATTFNDFSESNEFLREYRDSLVKWGRQRRQLQREVLPRILTKVTKTSLSQQRNETEHRCLQFLNVEGSHAVCMLTPPFDCGPLPEPVTLFCVGVATEDGCFLSGLQHRFELGHLYPVNIVQEETERSPICLAVQSWQHVTSTADEKYFPREENGGDNSGYVSNTGSDDSKLGCNCIFRGACTVKCFDNGHDGDGGEKEESDDCSSTFATASNRHTRIHRGRMGPRQWYCYAAVFDGNSSLIRINGIPEPIETNNLYPIEGEGNVAVIADDKNKHMNNKNNLMATSPPKAMLDGLTIGSDHCFGSTLCFGNGSDGEGEGAIAEIAVFSGRLDEADLCAIERHLMRKHNIPNPLLTHGVSNDTRCDSSEEPVQVSSKSTTAIDFSWWRDNEFDRLADALFERVELDMLGSDDSHGIPLRYLTRHHSVAWSQQNVVTGERRRLRKIGCRRDGSSSDF